MSFAYERHVSKKIISYLVPIERARLRPDSALAGLCRDGMHGETLPQNGTLRHFHMADSI